MKERLTGIEARDRGIAELCERIAPAGYRVEIPHDAIAVEDLDARLTPGGPIDGDGRPMWIYGSALPRRILERATKVQVHEAFEDDEAPTWFDHRFPEYIRETTVPGYSCFSSGSVSRAATQLLDEFCRVRLKDPNASSGVGQSTIATTDRIGPTLEAIAAEVRANWDVELDEYLEEHGYVVEADVDDVEAWSVTLTRAPDAHYSSFGRMLELTVDTVHQGVIQNYGGTSIVVVRGDPDDLTCVPDGGVAVHDPVVRDEELRLTPSPGIIRAAQRYIDGQRLWESDGVFETRANVDVITGTLTRRDGGREEIAAAVEDSGRAGGASPAELLGILALRAEAELPYAIRSSRHSFDSAARAYSDHAAATPGSCVFWDGIDPGWDDKYVFIGAF